MAAMVPFAWDDPFNLDDQLTEDERMIRDAAHAFAQGELQPRVIENFSKEVDDPELFPMMGEAGLLGATVPEEYGGAGASYVAYGLIAREIERKEVSDERGRARAGSDGDERAAHVVHGDAAAHLHADLGERLHLELRHLVAYRESFSSHL